MTREAKGSWVMKYGQVAVAGERRNYQGDSRKHEFTPARRRSRPLNNCSDEENEKREKWKKKKKKEEEETDAGEEPASLLCKEASRTRPWLRVLAPARGRQRSVSGADARSRCLIPPAKIIDKLSCPAAAADAGAVAAVIVVVVVLIVVYVDNSTI
ncbi:hypothetical protein PV325_000586 [Microctonus aethiopoides]|nr:hypothetical protein PV325_000586 [Microctonus aethiopoides]